MIKWIKRLFKKEVECMIYSSRLDRFSSTNLKSRYDEGWRAVSSSISPHHEIFVIMERSK